MSHRWEIHDLGPAITAVNVRAAGFGALPDGTPIAFTLSNGSAVVFSVIDVTTGKSLFCKEILGVTLGSWIVQAPDGDLYLSARHPTPAALYRFDIRARRLEHLADRLGGAQSLHSGVVDPRGRLWFGTHPHGKLITYDPATGELVDHGTLAPDAAWVFAVAIVGRTVWAGTGPVPHLFETDLDTGERQELHPPAHVLTGTKWFLRIDPRNEDVLVRLSPRGSFDTVVFHTRTRTWSPEVLARTHGGMPSPVSANGTTYVLTDHRELIGYHTHSRRVVNLPTARLVPPPAARSTVESYGLGMVRVPELGLPGQSVVGITTDGDLWFVSISTGQTRVVPAAIPAPTAEPHTISTGPDGHLYVGAYMGSGVIHRVDQHTGERAPLRGPRGCDTIIAHGQSLAITSSPGPQVHLAEPHRPWEWGINPREVLEGGTDLEPTERYIAAVTIGPVLALAVVAPFGPPTGTIVLLDPGSGQVSRIRPVPDQDVVSLAHHDGVLYGATTTVTARNRANPVPARLFAWDVVGERLLWDMAVSADARHLGGLLVDPEGLLIGSSSAGELFVVDPREPELLSLVPAGVAEAHPTWGNSARTLYDPASDSYLATAAGQLVLVPRDGGPPRVLAPNMLQVARAGNDRIFAIDETNLYLVDPPSS